MMEYCTPSASMPRAPIQTGARREVLEEKIVEKRGKMERQPKFPRASA